MPRHRDCLRLKNGPFPRPKSQRPGNVFKSLNAWWRMQSPSNLSPRLNFLLTGEHYKSKSARGACFIRVYHVANFVANSLSPMPVASYIHGMARAKHGSYIVQRPGSENWWVK